MKNSEQPVYPVIAPEHELVTTGLTKREYFAAMAMQAMVTRCSPSDGFSDGEAQQCIYIADELLKQLEQ